MIPADYLITLPDGGTIPLLFNTWFFREYSKRLGIEMEDLYPSGKSSSSSFKGKHLPMMLLLSAESFCRTNGKEFSYTDDDSCAWVDVLGGVITSPQVAKIYVMFFAKLTNVPADKIEVALTEAGSDKKKANH